MTIIQGILTIFLFFALSRVYLRFHHAQISSYEFIFWLVLFAGALFGVNFPNETTRLAQSVGIGRGVDLIVYGSVALLFYLVFRLYVSLENIRHEITELVRKLALDKLKFPKTSK